MSKNVIDPITLGVLWSNLETITEEMGNTLRMCAFSPLIREASDLSTALFDAKGRMIAQGVYTAGHLGAMPKAVKAMFREFPAEALKCGDAIVQNDPWIGSGHLPDLFVFTPIFSDREVVSCACSVIHLQGLGGRGPGGMAADVLDIFEEGIQIPMIKLYKRGKPSKDIFKIIRANSRVPDETTGDIEAAISANRVAENRFCELVKRYGIKTLDKYIDEMLRITEERMREAIDETPEGSYTFEDYMDDYGEGTNPIQIKVTIEVKGSNMKVDFAGTDSQQECGINSPFNYTSAYTILAIKSIIDPKTPWNEGCIMPIEITAPTGCIINPVYPAACGGRHVLAPRVYDVVLGALSKAVPEKVCAGESGTTADCMWGGIHPRTGRRFVFCDGFGGGLGGRPNKDGVNGICTVTNIGIQSIEIVESCFPLRIERFELWQDSGGPGKYRGGCGIRRDWKVITEHPLKLVTEGDRHKFNPWGLFGGKPAPKARTILNPGPREVDLPSKGIRNVKPGEVLRVQIPGGGGYGNPFKRDPEKVLSDVINGYVSLRSAEIDYGVAIDFETMKVNYVETKNLRRRFRN